MRARTSSALLVLLALGCTVGEGEGWVRSERLFIEDCWNGPFDLNPDFFAANPYRQESLQIRLQRGDNIEEQSDGLTLLINDLQTLRQNLGQPEQRRFAGRRDTTGVPGPARGGAAEGELVGVPAQQLPRANCRRILDFGEIRFASLFSGDPNETNAEIG